MQDKGSYRIDLWIKIYEALEKNGIDIALANPLKTRAIAEASLISWIQLFSQT